MNVTGKNEFVLHQELLKIWIDNPLSSVAMDAWGHAILTTLINNYPDIILREKTVVPKEDDRTLMVSDCTVSVLMDNLFKPETWAAGSFVVTNILNCFEELFEACLVVRGSVRILPEFDTDESAVNLHIFCAIIEGEPDGKEEQS